MLYPEGLSNLAQIGKTYYLHSPISPYYSYSKVPWELLFPTTNRRSYFLKSYVFCSANSVPLYLLLLTSTSTHTTSSLFPNQSYLLIRARCVAGLLKHGKVSRKHSNSYEIDRHPGTQYPLLRIESSTAIGQNSRSTNSRGQAPLSIKLVSERKRCSFKAVVFAFSTFFDSISSIEFFREENLYYIIGLSASDKRRDVWYASPGQ